MTFSQPDVVRDCAIRTLPHRSYLNVPVTRLERDCIAVEYAVAQVFGVARADLYRPTRGRAQIAIARQVAMYLTHVRCGWTYTEIGQHFDRDRTTVAHACAVVEDRRDNRVFDRTVELLEWVVPSAATDAYRYV